MVAAALEAAAASQGVVGPGVVGPWRLLLQQWLPTARQVMAVCVEQGSTRIGTADA